MWIGSCPQAVWKFLPVALPGANLCLVGKLVGWSVYVIVVNCIPFYLIPRRLNSRLETAHFNGSKIPKGVSCRRMLTLWIRTNVVLALIAAGLSVNCCVSANERVSFELTLKDALWSPGRAW